MADKGLTNEGTVNVTRVTVLQSILLQQIFSYVKPSYPAAFSEVGWLSLASEIKWNLRYPNWYFSPIFFKIQAFFFYTRTVIIGLKMLHENPQSNYFGSMRFYKSLNSNLEKKDDIRGNKELTTH